MYVDENVLFMIVPFSKDEFMVECPPVGALTQLRISHDNKGLASGWFLDHVTIEDLNEHRSYEFPCMKWLARNEDDGQIVRILHPKDVAARPQQVTTGKEHFSIEDVLSLYLEINALHQIVRRIIQDSVYPG